MDAQFANYHHHSAYPQYPHGQNPSQSRSDGACSGTYYSPAPSTPAFSPGSSSTNPSTPVVATPPHPPTEVLYSSAYPQRYGRQNGFQPTYGRNHGSAGPYDENLSFFQPHIDTDARTNVHSDVSPLEIYSGVVPPQKCCEPSTSAPSPTADLHYHDHAACASAKANNAPAFPFSRFAPPGVASPDSIDEFRTRWDSLGNLVRTPVPTSCGYQDCTFVGLPDTLWKHIVDTHHAGTTAKTSIRCGWDGCEPTNKPMMRRSLQRHILDAHLLYMKLHCPYCHYTSRDAEYAGRHGDDPAMCPERPAWEAHEGQGWARRDTCGWCQAITMIV
ncbi:hypothetical protein LXA43DRAFT_1093751 [Ganoderma leucocontextum]|nr:hypothetical protein LXA43DRAFT_1093751 [Ganoderma leucocontextum]